MEQNTAKVVAIAETLQSLSRPEAGVPDPLPRRRRRPPVLLALLAAGTVAGAALVLEEPRTALEGLGLPLPGGASTTPPRSGASAARIEPDAAPPVARAVASPLPPTEITASGHVTARTVAPVHGPEGERIAEVLVEVGDVVAAGAPLVRLEGVATHFALERARIALDAARLDVEARRMDLDAATAEEERASRLATRGIASERQAETALTARRGAELALERAHGTARDVELGHREAEHAAERLTVRAPFAGTVTELPARAGLVLAERSEDETRLLTLLDTTDLVVDADFAERAIAVFDAPLSAEAVLDAFPDEPFPLELERVAEMASAQTGTLTVRFALPDPPPGIRPNMAVQIRVTEAALTPAEGATVP